MKHTVTVINNGVKREFTAEHGENLLKLLQNNSVNISSPCAGNGTCGKCRVKIEGRTSELTAQEAEKLGESALKKGYRPACRNAVYDDINVILDDINNDRNDNVSIMVSGKENKIEIDPIIKKAYFEISKPSLNDQQAFTEKITKKVNELFNNNECCKKISICPDVKPDIMRSLPAILENNDYNITAVKYLDNIIGIEAGDTSGKAYGIAVDVGTTTIAGYLVDLINGKKIDTYSCINPQKSYGADVISRINSTMVSPEALDELNALVITCINGMISYFTDRNGIEADNIYAAAFAGNTTMLHFLMKLPCKTLAVSPFIPVTAEMQHIRASQLGININKQGSAIILPSVSAYVGGDTVAAVLASGMHEDKDISLLIDLGTNGEIVLGCKDWMYSCSTAAGPAFEGANIRNGVAGIQGAIDKVTIDTDIKYTTIGNKKAIGICGSGIVDAVAEMIRTGIIDETGRILDDDELESDSAKQYSERVVTTDGNNSFLIASRTECDCDDDIVITQKDVRELQNAKAAVAAGIRILIKEAGIEIKDIAKVYLAGGFGSYIDTESAAIIGLYPGELKGRIESIGNAAGIGSIQVLLSEKMLANAEKVKNMIKYIELSARPDFMDEYVECMMFE